MLSSADKLTDGGRSMRFAIGIWVATGFLLAASVVLGTTVFRGVGDEVLAVMLAFDAGAVLASLADTLDAGSIPGRLAVRRVRHGRGLPDLLRPLQELGARRGPFAHHTIWWQESVSGRG